MNLLLNGAPGTLSGADLTLLRGHRQCERERTNPQRSPRMEDEGQGIYTRLRRQLDAGMVHSTVKGRHLGES